MTSPTLLTVPTVCYPTGDQGHVDRAGGGVPAVEGGDTRQGRASHGRGGVMPKGQLMTLTKAISIAIRELKLAKSALALDANLYRQGARYRTAVNAYLRQEEIVKAIKVLQAAMEIETDRP